VKNPGYQFRLDSDLDLDSEMPQVKLFPVSWHASFQNLTKNLRQYSE